MTKPVKIKYQVNGNDEKLKAVFDAIEKNDVYALWRAYDADYHSGKATKEGSKKVGMSKLLLATLYQYPKIVRFLVNSKHDARHDLHDWNEDGQNPLVEAIKSGQVDIVKILAKAIANDEQMLSKSFKDERGNTPFHYIGEITDVNVRKEMATALIQAGMSIDFENHAGKKPKHHDELVAIKELNANRFIGAFSNTFFFKIKPSSMRSYLLWSLPVAALTVFAFLAQPVFTLFSALTVMSYLMLCSIATDSDTSRRGLLCETQLEADFRHTISCGKLTKDKLLQYFNRGGILIHQVGDLYINVLNEAARVGNVAQLSLLLEQGAIFERRAVHVAIEHGHTDAARFLLSKAKVMLVSEQESARLLVTAVHANKPEILAFLLAKGAKVSAEVRNHPFVKGFLATKPTKPADKAYSLLDFAKDLGHKEIVAMLEKAAKAAAKAPVKATPNVVTPNFTAKKQQARKANAAKKPAVVAESTTTRRQSLRAAKK